MYVILEQADGSLNITDTGDSFTKTEITPATQNQGPYIRVSMFNGNNIVNEEITGAVQIIGATGTFLLDKTLKELSKAMSEKPPAHCISPNKALFGWFGTNGDVTEQALSELFSTANSSIDEKLEDVRLIVLDPKETQNKMVCCVAKKMTSGAEGYNPLVVMNDRGQVYPVMFAPKEALDYIQMNKGEDPNSVGWVSHGEIKVYELIVDRYQNFWIKA